MTRVGRPLDFQHEYVQRLRRLIGRRSAREAEGLCVVESPKVLIEALDAGCSVDTLFVLDGWSDPAVDRSVAGGAKVFDLAPGVLEKVADTVTPQPMLAIVSSPVLGRGDFLGVLDGAEAFLGVIGVDLRDPGNVGSLIRSAEASGASVVVLCDGCVEAFSPKTLRASAGASFHVPIVQGGDPIEVLRLLASCEVRRLATAVRGDAVDYSANGVLTGRVAIVLGNEANGLDTSLDTFVDTWITIPMTGRTESLNVAMAGSILVFEAARQRRAATH